MSATVPPGEVASPCIRLCLLDEALGHCLGCGRTRAEIGRWPTLDAAARREVVRLARIRAGHPAAGPDAGDES